MSTYRLTPHNDPLNTTIGDGRTIYHIITPYHPVKDVTTISKQDEAVEKHPIAKITHHTFFADKIELKGEAFKMSHSGDSYAYVESLIVQNAV